MGARSSLTPRSERTSTFAPFSIATSAFAKNDMSEGSRPSGPSFAGKSISRYVTANAERELASPSSKTERRRRRAMACSIEERALHEHLVTALGRGFEEVAFGADARRDTREELFADRVERRVGHLCEELLEVVVEASRLFREHGERGIVAHRSECFFAAARHRVENELPLFFGHAERDGSEHRSSAPASDGRRSALPATTLSARGVREATCRRASPSRPIP